MQGMAGAPLSDESDVCFAKKAVSDRPASIVANSVGLIETPVLPFESMLLSARSVRWGPKGGAPEGRSANRVLGHDPPYGNWRARRALRRMLDLTR